MEQLGIKRCCSSSLSRSLIHQLIILLLFIISTQSDLQNSHDHQQIVERLPLGSILHPNQTLVSRNGSFALQFFSLGLHRNYLGVCYAGIPVTTRIWMANRNDPAEDGAFLAFRKDGNLVLSNPDQTTVWMSGTSGRNISSMVMEESGNLILTSHHVSGITAIWQSFQHPTDTLMPGMKLYVGTDFIASKSLVDPAEGRFSSPLLPTLEFVHLWNATTQYATTGIWNGHTFADSSTLSLNLSFVSFSFVNDSRRPYLIAHEVSKSLFHGTVEYDGVFRGRIWDSSAAMWHIIQSLPYNPCQVDHLCGQNGICNSDSIPFCSCPQGFKPVDPMGWNEGDWSLGCVANFTLDCSTKTFISLQHTYYDHGGGPASEKSYIGHDQAWCQASCTSDCACLGFSFDLGSSNCSLQYGSLFNGKSSPEIRQNFFLRVNSSEQLLNDEKRKRRTDWITDLGVAFGCALMLMIVFVMWRKFSKKCTIKEQSSEYMSEVLRKFSYKELRTATKNFGEELGAGGFGSVYKGSLPDQTMVAVKKLVHSMNQEDKDFRREVSTLGMIQHVNLARLCGFCTTDMHRLIVYDYMPNGSLDKLLFKKPGAHQQTVLDWDTRFDIALGTARGILYLHEECRNCIIHCDIKPANILLDANFCAKVSDFGLAKLMGREFSRVITSMRGTRGYLAPEWLSGVPVTTKADVYSYGMTLFEIISGRKNMDVNNSSVDKWFFPLWACQKARLGEFSSLADITLFGRFNEQQLKKAVLVAIWCIQDEETDRPSMSRVVHMLEGTLQVADPPFPTSLNLFTIEARNNSALADASS